VLITAAVYVVYTQEFFFYFSTTGALVSIMVKNLLFQLVSIVPCVNGVFF